MSDAPYTGPRSGDGLIIIEVLLSHLDTKERPGKLHIVAAATIDFSLLPIEGEGSRRSDTSPYVIDSSRIK